MSRMRSSSTFLPAAAQKSERFEISGRPSGCFSKKPKGMGTLHQILREAGYREAGGKVQRPFISVEQVSLPLPLTHAKA